MIQNKFSRYFWHNMRLFTSIFYVICIFAAAMFLWITAKNQREMLEIRYQNAAEACCMEIDSRLREIQRLINDISMITWVKKLSSNSEVFLREFNELDRMECQAELSRYLATDSAISDIAVYLTDRGVLLSPRGWFSESEYKVCMGGRYGLDLDAVLAAAGQKGNLLYFGEEAYNRGSQRDIAIVSNLVNVEEPPASLILILNRNVFNQSIAKLGSEAVLGIEVLNLSGEEVFRTAEDIPEAYEIEMDSAVFPLSYRITYPEPSEVMGQSHIFTMAFVAVMLVMLTLAALLSFLLSLHNIRPLQKLVGRIGDVAGELLDSPGETTEFEQIEGLFQSLYLQKKGLQDSLKENEKQARQYALLLILSGDEKFVQRGVPWFETLEIPFTEEQAYFVWMVLYEGNGKVGVLSLFLELQPLLDSVEEVRTGPGQLVLIIGYKPEETVPDLEETVELVRLLAMERQNILLKIETEKTDKPGIAGISQAYYRLVRRMGQREEIPEEDLRGKEIAGYIDAHFCDPELSLKDLGQRWNLSVSTVSRLCKESLGVSFLAYLTELRLRRAKELLMNADMTPAQAAEAVGYTSEYSFRRAFSRNENCRLQDWMAAQEKKE